MLYAFQISGEFLKEYKYTIVLFLIFTILAYPLESIAVPQLYGRFFEALNEKTPVKKIFTFLAMIAGLLLIVKISDGVIHHLESKIIPDFNRFILNYIFKNLLIKYQNNYTDLEMGKLISRINTIPAVLRELSTDITIWVLPKFIAIIIINAYFLFLNSTLGIVSIIMITFIFIVNIFMGRTCVTLSNQRHHLLEKNSEDVQNKLTNLFSIYSNGKVKDEIMKYSNDIEDYSEKYRDNMKCVNNLRYINSIYDILLFIVLNGVTVYLYLNKKISFALLMAIFITVIYYLPCISSISSSLPDLVHYFGVLSETNEFLGEIYRQEELVEQKPEIKMQTGDITIQNLNFGYSDRKKIFNNFNLHIPDKQKICIAGHSGNGKSTLIKLIMGYYPVGENMILLDYKDITKYDLNSLRKQISYVNQNNKLFNGTIYENIQYGNNLSKKDIDNLVKRLEISSIYQNLKDGFESDVGVQGDKLSGGQKQMIHILRTFGNKSKIIILDEPTGALDPENKKIILKTIKELSKNSTMILITHDQSIMNMCDRIITVDNGKIVDDKTYNQ